MCATSKRRSAGPASRASAARAAAGRSTSTATSRRSASARRCTTEAHRDPAPAPRPAVARETTVLPTYHPRRIQHVNYLTADTPRVVAWYEQVLGMRVTDWIGEDACWLHTGRDHHVLAFLDKGYGHIHHIAFELVDWGEIRVALDHLGQHGRWVTWGPGRHAMAQNLFAYVRMAEEELF